MSLRWLLVALVIAATAAFVVGVSIERGDEPAHHAAGEAAGEQLEVGGEGEAQHAGGEATEGTTTEETHAELRPLGVD
jgi:hypothetical protein